MVKRLTEEEVLNRINYLWEQFHIRPEMNGVSYEDFKNECLAEFTKQNKMSDDDLEKYRKDSYNKLIEEVDQLTTQEEKDKLNQEDNQTISPQEEANFNKR